VQVSPTRVLFCAKGQGLSRCRIFHTPSHLATERLARVTAPFKQGGEKSSSAATNIEEMKREIAKQQQETARLGPGADSSLAAAAQATFPNAAQHGPNGSPFNGPTGAQYGQPQGELTPQQHQALAFDTQKKELASRNTSSPTAIHIVCNDSTRRAAPSRKKSYESGKAECKSLKHKSVE